MSGNGLDLQKLFAMQAQLKKENPPLEGVKQEIIEVEYLRKDGGKDVRPVRLNIPPKAKAPMPLIFVPHYEMKEDSLEIRDYLLKGWAVASCAEFKMTISSSTMRRSIRCVGAGISITTASPSWAEVRAAT